MTIHATLGASSSKRWMNCHASVPASHIFPNKTSGYAAEGTVAHMVCEIALLEGRPASHYIGRWGDGSEEHKDEGLYPAAKKRTDLEFEVTEEMARAVQIFLDAVNAEMEVWTLQGLEPHLNVEKGFSLTKVMGREDMFGTNDASIWVPSFYLGVFDYKHGKGEVVEVEDNSQLKYYALGALIELCWNDIFGEFDTTLLPERVELIIGQPRAGHANGPIRRWEMTPLQLIEDFVAEMKEDVTIIDRLMAMFPNIDNMKIEAIMEALPMENFAPGEWCKWCKAKIFCKALKREGQRAMTQDFADDGLSLEEWGDVVAEDTKGMITKTGANKGSPSAKQINSYVRDKANELAKLNIHGDPAQLVRLLNAADLLEAFAKAVRQHVYNQVTQGVKMPGYKLVRQATKRGWNGDRVEIAETLGLFGLTEEQVYAPRTLKSFTEIEEMSPETAKLIEGLTVRPEGALVLVKEGDKREAVTPSAADAFGDDTLELSEFNGE